MAEVTESLKINYIEKLPYSYTRKSTGNWIQTIYLQFGQGKRDQWHRFQYPGWRAYIRDVQAGIMQTIHSSNPKKSTISGINHFDIL